MRATVVSWSASAARLLGLRATEVVGRSAFTLLMDPDALRAKGPRAGMPWTGIVALRDGGGREVRVDLHVTPLQGSCVLVLAVPAGRASNLEPVGALFRALFAQHHMAMAVHDLGLCVQQTNTAAGLPGALTDAFEGAWLDHLAAVDGSGTAHAHLRELAGSGIALVNRVYRLHGARSPGREPVLALTAVRLEDTAGRPTGVATAVTDVTEVYRTRHRIDLMYQAAATIGGTLDVGATTRQLVDVLVPALGDMATVDVLGPVLDGEEPTPDLGDCGVLHRLAVKHAHGPWPAALIQPGAELPPIPDRPEPQGDEKGDHVTTDDAEQSRRLLRYDPTLVSLLLPAGTRESMGAPLFARGVALGYVLVYRTKNPRPFDEEDARLLREIVSRAALSIDNARRYTHEHRTALLLQRSLMPRASTQSAAAETVGAYRPAGNADSVGGDWFDVIPLSSLRVALVIGDVTGHGLQATTTMARLRTAVQTLSDLDLDPDELLTRLDDLVHRIAAEAANPHSIGASCLYAVYDPVTRLCRLASAGHPPPALVRPDGRVESVPLAPGPELGMGSLPFEVTEIVLEPGSVLALHTNGLTEHDHPSGPGTPGLFARLTAALAPGRALEEAANALVTPRPSAAPPAYDATLLLARTRTVAPHNTALWQLPPDPAAVATARRAASRQLSDWGLDDLILTTELVVSELVTNAIRYATGPVELRLTRDRILVCEVSDTSNSQPRLRRARSTDEGGRGLFLVSQVTSRWGSRYGTSGKTIWTEQPVAHA